MSATPIDKIDADGAVMPDGSPCGPDMEYAAAFLEFMDLATGRPEQQLGDSVLPAQEPDWRQVLDKGCALLTQTRDLRIAVTVTRATTELHGLTGFAAGLRLIHTWLARFWDPLHPMIVIDGERDPLLRSNALSALGDPEGMLRSVRNAPLLESHAGTIRVGDADLIVRGRSASPDAAITSAEQLSRIVSAERERNAERVALLSEARRSLAAIDAISREQVESEYWPALAPLGELLARVEGAVLPEGEAQSPAEASPEAADGEQVHAPRAPTTNTLPAQIDTRSDAFRALAMARAYFERNEPSHPAPLLIRRIERLSDLDFSQIVAELAPEGLAQLNQLAGASRP